MITKHLASAAWVKQNTREWNFEPLFLFFLLPDVLFSDYTTGFMGNWLQGYLHPCKVMEKKDYATRNVFAVSWNITNLVKCHFEWESKHILIRIFKGRALQTEEKRRGSASCNIRCHVWSLPPLWRDCLEACSLSCCALCVSLCCTHTHNQVKSTERSLSSQHCNLHKRFSSTSSPPCSELQPLYVCITEGLAFVHICISFVT